MSYQAVYDAAFKQFDISWLVVRAMETITTTGDQMTRPSVLMRPAISMDGNKWCCLYGENLQEGVTGFGNSPSEACEAFDCAWFERLK